MERIVITSQLGCLCCASFWKFQTFQRGPASVWTPRGLIRYCVYGSKQVQISWSKPWALSVDCWILSVCYLYKRMQRNEVAHLTPQWPQKKLSAAEGMNVIPTEPSGKAVHKEVGSWSAETVMERGTGLDCHGWRVWWQRKQRILTGGGDHWRRKCACLSLARLRTAWRPFPPWPAHSHAYSKWTTNIWTMRLWNVQK